jgi:hypothetical protein
VEGAGLFSLFACLGPALGGWSGHEAGAEACAESVCPPEITRVGGSGEPGISATTLVGVNAGALEQYRKDLQYLISDYYTHAQN